MRAQQIYENQQYLPRTAFPAPVNVWHHPLMPIFDPLTELKKALAEARSQQNGKVIAVVGSGVSLSAAPGQREAGWPGFLELAIEHCLQTKLLTKRKCESLRNSMKSRNGADLVAAASFVEEALRKKAGVFESFLRSTVGALRPTSRGVLDALIDLKIPLATTNYDGLIEVAADRQAVTWRDHGNVERLLKGDIRGVLHLHGHWNEPESIVLGAQSYERVLADGHTQAVLRKLFLDRTLLFVGFGAGFEDPNFGGLLKWASSVITGADCFHCRLGRINEVPELKAQHPLTQRVWIIPYGKEYDELAPFLRSLTEHSTESGKVPKVDGKTEVGLLIVPLKKLPPESQVLLGLAVRQLLEPERQRIPTVAKVHAAGQIFQVSLNPVIKQDRNFRRESAVLLSQKINMLNDIKFAIATVEETISRSDDHKHKLRLRDLEQNLGDTYQNLQNVLATLIIKIMVSGADKEAPTKATSRVNKTPQVSAGKKTVLENPTRASLRKFLDEFYPIDSILNALAIDHFDTAYQQFSTGMDRNQKINYIFSHYSVLEIAEVLRARHNAK